MSKLCLVVLAGAWVFAGWKNMPRMPHSTSTIAGLTVAGTVLLAYWLGRRSMRSTVAAVAIASAEATAVAAAVVGDTSSSSTVNLFLGGAVPPVPTSADRAVAGLDRASWLVDARPVLDLDEREALEASLDDQRDVAVLPAAAPDRVVSP